jgi:fatty acid desaturase
MVANPDGDTPASQVGRRRRALFFGALGAFALAIMFLAGALATSAWWMWGLALGWSVMGVVYLRSRRGLADATLTSR